MKQTGKINRIVVIVTALPLLLTGCSAEEMAALARTEETEEVEIWESIPEGASAEELTQEAAAEEEIRGEQAESEGDGEADPEHDEEAGEAEAEETVTEETVTEETLVGVMTGSEEAIALVTAFVEERGISSSNISIAYTNLVTGETFYYNEDKLWDGCSTYKLPLNLLFYDMEAAGEITADTVIPGTGGYTLANCHHQSLEFSNNELSEAMVDYLGDYLAMKSSMLQYFGVEESAIDSSYYNHNYFSARMMMGCFVYLYGRQEQYAEALGYLKAAQPGEYFKTYLSDCTIAQKYGLRDSYTHTAGIIFSDTPFALSIYSSNAGGGTMIGSLARLFYDYTNGT